MRGHVEGPTVDEPGAVPRGSPRPAFPLASPPALSAPVWSFVPALGGPGDAGVTVGLVLAEALVLYAGYGALTRVAAPAVRAALGRP